MTQGGDVNRDPFAGLRRVAKALLGPRLTALARKLARIEWWLSSPSVETFTPAFMRSWRRKLIFSRIYLHNRWGHDASSKKFFSGPGSRGPAVDAYIEMITTELTKLEQQFGRPISVLDLGCGDFAVGREIIARLPSVTYLGCDIVPALIEHHQAAYADSRTAFRRLDIVSDKLLNADVCLIRQVLQHLSNDDISSVITKLDKFAAVYISERQQITLEGPANRPKPVGAGVRFDWTAGKGRSVELDQPPFGLNVLPVLVARSSGLENIVTVKLLRDEAQTASPPVTPNIKALPTSIPKLIFQTWKSKVDLPQNFELWSATFLRKNPSYELRIWDDFDNRRFISENFPWFLKAYDAYPAEIYRVDAVRCFFLYTHGGLYADLDVECLKPLDEVLSAGDVVLGRMGSDPDNVHSIPNAIMASKPRQEFWLLMMGLLEERAYQDSGPEHVTGPAVLKSAVDIYLGEERRRASDLINGIVCRLPSELLPAPGRSRLNILKSREWFPIDWTDPLHRVVRRKVLDGDLLSDAEKKEFFPNSSLVTYWSHSWG